MNRFEYAAPATLDEAFVHLGGSFAECELLAGGTDLLSLMKDFVVEPKRLVSLSRVQDLKGIKADGNAVTIGAMTTLDELLENAAVTERFPALAQAVRGIRSTQMRAMGTVGGELLQRPRCWYFRRGFGLLAQKDGASMVEAGDHRYHAILGNQGAAKFVSASSLAPALCALNAAVEIVGKDGGRWAEVRDLYRIPGSNEEREHVVGPGEILRAIQIPGNAPASATYEVRPRHGLDWPEVGASVRLSLEGGKVTEVGACLGHVAPIPWVVSDAVRKEVIGKAIDDAVATAAANHALSSATPLRNNVHKVELAKVALKRALLSAFGKQV